MSEIGNIEKKIGKEILNEWYLEKGLSVEEIEKEAPGREDEPSPQFIPSSDDKSFDDTKKEEEDKKSLVKKEIRQLLAIAEERGLEQSIKEAQKKNDPFLLDIYHDVLAKDGSYKKIIGK